MNTMKWLLRREFWEHKGALLWAPLTVALAMVVLIGGGFVYSMAFGGPQHVQFDGHTVVSIEGFPAALRYKVAHIAANGYLGVAAPLFLVLSVVVFFYCLAALHDDRRDRSILFWKSLPLSDRDTVLSKAVTALCVAPLITTAIAVATALLLLVLGMVGAASKGLNLFAPVLTEPSLYLSPLYLLAFLPLYILWALPTVGWLLLVSSWARSKVFLWAVGAPLIALVLLTWFNFLLGQVSSTGIDTDFFAEEVIMRGLGGLVPGVWLSEVDGSRFAGMEHGVDAMLILGESYRTLAAPGVWVGAAAGVAMIYGAMRLRRYRDEG
jgi:ABC-2 type transport system permease protein